MPALGTGEAKFRHCLGRVREQALAVSRIGPRFGDDARAVARPDAGLVGVDDRVDCGRIDQAFFREYCFQSLHARCRPAVVGIVMVSTHGFTLFERVARLRFCDFDFDFVAIGSR